MVIGEGGRNIPKGEVLSHISRICLGLDLTDRQRQTEMRKRGLPWFDSKCFPGAAVITKREPADWPVLENDFWLNKNGTEVQRGNIDDMVFDIPSLVSALSRIVAFREDDLVFTGTPSGVGPLSDGDLLTLGIGDDEKATFRVTVSSAAKTP